MWVRKRKAILVKGFLEERWKNLGGLEWELVEWEMAFEMLACFIFFEHMTTNYCQTSYTKRALYSFN